MTHEVGHRNCCTKHFDRRQGKVEGQPTMAAPVSLSVGVCVGSAGWLAAGWWVPQLHPVVVPQVSHFKHVPFLTIVKLWHSVHWSPV